MSSRPTLLDTFASWFFQSFFGILVFASSAAMWTVPAWLSTAVFGVEIAWYWHVAGVLAALMLNRAVIARGRRRPARWLRRYSAVALSALICWLFLVGSAALFGAGWLAVGLVDADGARTVASMFDFWGTVGIAGLSLMLVFGYTAGQRQFGINEITVPVAGWTGRLRILQLSDIHVGQNMAYDHLQEFVARANAEEPDLICLTGDIADGPHADMERFFPLLGQLRARLGVWAILGNHDHHAGAERVRDALENNGIRVLCDQAVTIDVGDGAALHVIGLDDRGIDWARGVRRHDILTRLLDEAPEGIPQLLLVHRPDIFEQASEAGVELTLSGHTHGGQLGVPWFGGKPRNLAQVMTAFDRGLFRCRDSVLYVNCGLGVTGQRIRLFTPREISIFELRAVEAAAQRTGDEADLTGLPVLSAQPIRRVARRSA